MAITKTGAIFKTFTFDGQKSSNYGVYITGQAVYNAPERAVEMITIPGRNGAFAQDNGRFENIEVTYPAGAFADTEADFADAISNLRNMLCSRVGYCKLSDDYNATEYRMAIYKSGLEVSPEALKAGEFNITFECQPQRFLTSGDTKSTLSSPATVTNPTLFASKPQFQVTGYGDIDINGEKIEVDSSPIGDVLLYDYHRWYSTTTQTITVDTTFANVNDTIRTQEYVAGEFNTQWKKSTGSVNSFSVTSTTGNGEAIIARHSDSEVVVSATLGHCDFSYGTSQTESVTGNFSIVTSNNGTVTGSLTYSLAYDGNDTFTLSRAVTVPTGFNTTRNEMIISPLTLESTKLMNGLIYIDMEIGEAYEVVNDSVVPVNHGIIMPPDLITLKPGTNTITFDNTFTKVDLIPRWWKV